MLRRWLCVCLLLLAGCMTTIPSAPPPTDAPPPPALTPAPPTLDPTLAALEPIGPEAYPSAVNPLTGLPLPDGAPLERRPMVVKISNAPPIVRPQAGIGAADLVFEHYAEGGLTRFSAVFYSQAPTRVGSIRSARLIDDALVPMLGGLLAYSGASDGVMGVLSSSEYFERTYMGVRYGLPYFWRDENIDVPHNLFVNAAALYELAAREGFGQDAVLAPGLGFTAAPPPGEDGPALLVDIIYKATRAQWIYDAERGQYLRFSDGLPHFDANTMTQVAAENVVILYAPHRATDIIESQWQGAISWSIEIALWGSGEALVLRDGRVYRGQWSRPARDSMLTLRTADGQPLYLRPGATWFQLFPPPDEQDPAEEAVRIG